MNRRVCWIPGGSRGIGAGCAKALAADYTVAVGYQNRRSDAEAVAEAIRQAGGQASVYQTDITDRESVFRTVRSIESELGSVDLLVCCAGVAWTGLVQDMTAEEVHRVVDTDLCGTVFACQAVLPGMISRHEGCIVTVSSIWGICGASCEAVYSAAKAGVIGFTKALAAEVGPSGIRVNCVAPGVIRTEMLSNLTADDLEALREETPLGRLGEPSDIAAAVRYFAGADFVTGQVLSPNGGFII